MTSRSACAYGRAADTRSCARFIFDVATISIVRVILRVFSTDLMRLLSSRPLAIDTPARHPEAAKLPKGSLSRRGSCAVHDVRSRKGQRSFRGFTAQDDWKNDHYHGSALVTPAGFAAGTVFL